MKVIITGANGQLGLELVKQLQSKDEYEVISTNKYSLNIVNFNSVNDFILDNKPDVLINCAAYTSVDLCEENIEDAYKLNALGPKNLAIACEKIGAKLVQISTDYVFDGSSRIAYREDNETKPNSIYGRSKLMGEQFVKDFCSRYFVIRTAWLYGDGNNFVRTMLKLSENNKEINVVSDQYGNPTSTIELSRVIINLINTEYYGIYHATSEGYCSWYEFAKKIFQLSNIDIKLNPITRDEFKLSAQRPSYSALDNFMLRLIGLNSFKNWEDSLKEYIDINNYKKYKD